MLCNDESDCLMSWRCPEINPSIEQVYFNNNIFFLFFLPSEKDLEQNGSYVDRLQRNPRDNDSITIGRM